MTYQELESILKPLIIKVNAIELTLRESNMADEYQKNIIFWEKELHSKIGQGLLDDALSPDLDEAHPEPPIE